MQQADQGRHTQEIRVSLNQHSLDLVKFGHTAGTLLLRSFLETVCHGRENLELPI